MRLRNTVIGGIEQEEAKSDMTVTRGSCFLSSF